MAKIKPKSKPATKSAKVSKPKIDRGEGAYAVQAKKMKALIETLREADGALEEAKVIKELARRGFPVHPRTLLREVERIRILGYNVVREIGEAGVTYAMHADPKVAEAIASLDAVRKDLRKAGSPLEKQIASALKVLKA